MQHKHFLENKILLRDHYAVPDTSTLLYKSDRQNDSFCRSRIHSIRHLSRTYWEPPGTVRGAGILVAPGEHQRARESISFQEAQAGLLGEWGTLQNQREARENLKNGAEGAKQEAG